MGKNYAALLFSLAFLMSGCAHRQLSNANEIKKGRAHDAASKTINTVSSDDPKIVFKSRGMPAIVAYSISSSPRTAKGSSVSVECSTVVEAYCYRGLRM